jgi:putative PEP-CTERM system histidine kinase
MSVWVLPFFLSAGISLFLGAMLFLKKNEGHIFFPLILVMVIIAWIHGLNGVSYFFQRNLVMWKTLILLGEVAFPVALGYVSQTFLQKTSPSGFTGSGWWKIVGGGACILGVSVLVWPDRVMGLNSDGEIVFTRSAGLAFWSFILISLIIGLSQLEQILRSVRDPLRYQLKFVLIGLGGLAGISIVQASQLLLLPVWKQTITWIGGVAACFSLALIGFGLGRWRMQDYRQKVQVSHHALYTSLTFLLVGGYLIFVGIVAEMIRQTGWALGEAFGVLLLFVASMGLVVVIVSRQARAEIQQFVARHFFRTKYDYRQKWLEVTEAFSACNDTQQIWDRYLEWLSQTFGAPRVTIWKKFDVDRRFHQIRSINIEDPPSPISESHPIILAMIQQKGLVFVDEDNQEVKDWGDFVPVTQAKVCMPLATNEGPLLGFCTLSKELHDRSYDQDDFDLLRAIAYHVTMLLIQLQLIEERSSTAKWEAVHRFSGFYLHDLKNLASSLSMVARNAEHYGHDPDFQASAMRTVRGTSQRIMDLMAKLASQSKFPGADGGYVLQPVDMNILVKETLEALTKAGCKPTFHPGKELPSIRLNGESIKQVLLNLILNAQQAMGEKGTIDISTSYDGIQIVVEVVDTGPGISAVQLENLFQPFRSSKKTGLGVGLFHCKQIVEDQQGVIRIESQEGRGTKVIVTFPAPVADR